ncbi:uncharacterized protein LACBIDRAFT_327634 [Laccaria bicolor S238N-H82]|uniref:Predicted protein n=1 Tax=Laccaria bicolor (strain S238N-H82 / ATCC MYA-4686) TaxID=486041 RepID=B0DCC6_LACBS|nr:uncharacterized protein LACBIDRAFT_327634 [Laccaria bicolor S238N-H82]EDR07877.1 predicted protein [Laccaria bicolor S238N-H82]|eukprot:XP_001881666.1 predicted protein [Laccaria bicolor S238N-H82]
MDFVWILNSLYLKKWTTSDAWRNTRNADMRYLCDTSALHRKRVILSKDALSSHDRNAAKNGECLDCILIDPGVSHSSWLSYGKPLLWLCCRCARPYRAQRETASPSYHRGTSRLQRPSSIAVSARQFQEMSTQTGRYVTQRCALKSRIAMKLLSTTAEEISYAFLKPSYNNFNWTNRYVPNDLRKRGFPLEDLNKAKYCNYGYARNIACTWEIL